MIKTPQPQLNKLSKDELKQLQKKNKSLLLLFIAVLAFLTGVVIYSYIKTGFTTITILPVIFLPALLFANKNLNLVNSEIKSRENGQDSA